MEIRHAATNQLVFNQTKLTSPDFAAFGLKSSTGYIVTFFAANTKGKKIPISKVEINTEDFKTIQINVDITII